MAALALSLPTTPACACNGTISAKLPMKTRRVERALVAWYSQTGNTGRYGRLLAATMRRAGVQVTAGDMRELDRPGAGKYDLIVVGAPVFYYDAPMLVQNWVRSLPDLGGAAAAAYVSFGGPEGNQHNAACSILECLVERGAVPVAQKAFMNLGTYPLSWAGDKINKTPWRSRNLPDRETYQQVRRYAQYVLDRVAKGQSAEFSKKVTMREISTFFGPIWWTKRSIDQHYILADKCIACGACVEKCPVGAIDLGAHTVNREACVLCFGCLNNCPAQAVYMDQDGTRLVGYREFLKIKHIKISEPPELKA
ncbi:MAG: EFR1 family ferrodoxin [Desulfarculaceae bacterium]|nr:EFR1 family ferrodoxin [Desulfarculaceae bacterium]MCF8100727.1 EFR1 family ferrodoxin [Desulfarculaceae bacterium]MCF8115465.1 EFR1 family ferrodoxin [Desulfarculaceae bacterium]